MNLEQDQTTPEVMPKTQEELRGEISNMEDTLNEFKQKATAEKAEFGQASVDVENYIKDLTEIIASKKLSLEGGETLKNIEEGYKSDSEANISFHNNLISGLERGIAEKSVKIEAAKLEEAALYEKELASNKGEMTAEENVDFQLLQAKKKNNEELIKDLEAKIGQDKEAIETHKKTIESQESKKA